MTFGKQSNARRIEVESKSIRSCNHRINLWHCRSWRVCQGLCTSTRCAAAVDAGSATDLTSARTRLRVAEAPLLSVFKPVRHYWRPHTATARCPPLPSPAINFRSPRPSGLLPPAFLLPEVTSSRRISVSDAKGNHPWRHFRYCFYDLSKTLQCCAFFSV